MVTGTGLNVECNPLIVDCGDDVLHRPIMPEGRVSSAECQSAYWVTRRARGPWMQMASAADVQLPKGWLM